MVQSLLISQNWKMLRLTRLFILLAFNSLFLDLLLPPLIFIKHRNADSAWQSFWDKMSEDERIQFGLIADFLTHAEVYYYKGLGYKRFGIPYLGNAITALHKAVRMCGPGDEDLKAKCEREIGNNWMSPYAAVAEAEPESTNTNPDNWLV